MPSPSPRPAIAAMARYNPNLGAPRTGRIIRLSANEGALGPSPKAMQALKEATGDLHYYPSEDPRDLAEAIGEVYGLDFIRPE